ncbi:MAG: hypothetical protein K0U47_00335 [Epsilonproteobacteria bacterium]|nr:hypothetical protein [Campylobacterota bacterium]
MTIDKNFMSFYLVMGIILAFLLFMALSTAWIMHDVNKKAIRDLPTLERC